MPHRSWLLLLLLWTAVGRSQSIEETVSRLTSRILTLTPARAQVSLSFQNRSALPEPAFSAFQRALEQEVKQAGLLLNPAGSPEFQLRVTISDTFRESLLIAEFDHRTVMVAWDRPVTPTTRNSINLERTILIQQDSPILDFRLVSDSGMLVLEPTRVVQYEKQPHGWSAVAAAPLVLSRPMPRDPRGRLLGNGDTFEVHVPGTNCTGVMQRTLSITCTAAGMQLWPADPNGPQVRWANGRNYLEASSLSFPFYSAVSNLYAGLDERIYDRSRQPIAGTESWTGDFATIDAGCGANNAVIVSQRADQLGVYDLSSGQPAPLTESLDLTGTVTALWRGAEHGDVSLVSRNRKTGKYEAALVAATCAD